MMMNQSKQVIRNIVQKTMNQNIPKWYQQLNEYFPITEMKDREHFEALLKERGDLYKKDVSDKHVMLYSEGENSVLIDYLWVSKNARGQNLGKMLLQKVKSKKKNILVEVEPADQNDSDTIKRLKFYKREGFRHGRRVQYKKKSPLDQGSWAEMEVLYWDPTLEMEDHEYPITTQKDDESVANFLKFHYENIHGYKHKDFYGFEPLPPEQVVRLDQSPKKDILLEL